MNINLNFPTSSFYQTRNNKQYLPNCNLKQLQADTISFGAKNIPTPVSRYSQEAIKLGVELYNRAKTSTLTHEDIEEELQKAIPIIKIDNTNNIPAYTNPDGLARWLAYCLPKYDNQGQLETLTLYLEENIKSPLQFSHLVHEYTHSLQRYNDDSYMGAYTILGKRDINLARGLCSIANFVFNHLQAEKQGKAFKDACKLENRGMQADKALAQAYGFKKLEDFKKSFSKLYNDAYSKVLPMVLSDKANLPFIPFKDEPDKLKSAVRQMCANLAKTEQEAYESQKLFIKKVDKHTMTDVNKMSPVFYQVVADALSAPMY